MPTARGTIARITAIIQREHMASSLIPRTALFQFVEPKDTHQPLTIRVLLDPGEQSSARQSKLSRPPSNYATLRCGEGIAGPCSYCVSVCELRG